MPVVKKCVFRKEDTVIEASLKVSTAGEFSIQRPGTPEDWKGQSMIIKGTQP